MDEEAREEGGTPRVIGSVKAALAMEAKQVVMHVGVWVGCSCVSVFVTSLPKRCFRLSSRCFPLKMIFRQKKWDERRSKHMTVYGSELHESCSCQVW